METAPGGFSRSEFSRGESSRPARIRRPSRPRTTTPSHRWDRDAQGRYVEPGTGRPLNNDGTYDMRRAENKDLPNPSSRVRIGTNNAPRASEIQRQVQHEPRNRVVINHYYTNIYNTYIVNHSGYGSWGWQRLFGWVSKGSRGSL